MNTIQEMSTTHLIIETVLALACVYFFILFIKSIISTVKYIIQILKEN